MRGDDLENQGAMWSYVPMEQRIPPDHPVRAMRPLVDAVLRELSPRFAELYSRVGRPSIAPEKLLRALLLQVLYTVRSERLLMEQLDYNLLFRWFVGLEMDDPVWNATVFTKNRERLLAGDIARGFFDRVVAHARERGLLSDEHFTVDGTLDRNGLAVGGCVIPASGYAERAAALELLGALDRDRRLTLGADKGYDTRDFVAAVRLLGVTPHVAQNTRHRASAIDGRTTRHAGYAVSQQRRKRVEEIFGWLKTVGLMRKTRHRGARRVDWMFTLALAAYNLVRLRNLTAQEA